MKTDISKVFLMCAPLVISACGMKSIGQEPEFSPMGVDSAAGKAQVLSIPQPKTQAPKDFKRAEATSLWAAGNDGFFEDQRASEIGDILTVNIEISDKASLSNETEVEKSAANGMSFPTFFGYGSKLSQVLPGITQDDLPQGDVVDLSSSSESSGAGSVDRKETISLKVAALVVDKLPNGTLVIAGRQEVRVNYELRELRVTGLVRKEDITTDNTVSYDKIAEARISYGGRGIISKVQKPSYGKEALDVVLPY